MSSLLTQDNRARSCEHEDPCSDAPDQQWEMQLDTTYTIQ